MDTYNGRMAIKNGQDARGRFLPGHKLAKGRPLGSHNKATATERLLSEKGQSATGVRFYDVLASIISDLGGPEALSTAQLQLARRCAWVSVQCEALEKKAAFEPSDVTAYTMMMGHLARTLRVLGLKRQPRDVTPSLKEYLAAARAPIETDDIQ
jgi:hypothetical protein